MLVALLLAVSLAGQLAPVPRDRLPATDPAGNRLEPLTPMLQSVIPDHEDRESTGLWCNGPERSWCVSGRREEDGSWRLTLSRYHRLLDFRPTVFTVPETGEGSHYDIWPHLIRERDGSVMFGLLTTRGTSYSGGGASVTRLTLVRHDEGTGGAVAVLDVPLSGSATIRACFFEADARARRNACQDEYALDGSLRLDPADPGLPDHVRPRFVFETRARTWPGRVARDADSRDRGPLRARDLVWWRDPTCSYRRTFNFDETAGRYLPDAPLPECSDYLDIGE